MEREEGNVRLRDPLYARKRLRGRQDLGSHHHVISGYGKPLLLRLLFHPRSGLRVFDGGSFDFAIILSQRLNGDHVEGQREDKNSPQVIMEHVYSLRE